MNPLVSKIRESVIGARQPIATPFGDKPLVYADYTASGRALGFIEDYIRDQVLPLYANTHSETSHTGAATTRLREQAREEIRRGVNAGDDDRVIFCGSGATAAVNRLVDLLGLRLPTDPARRAAQLAAEDAATRPVVFIGPYEHHSNELPWRESLAEVVPVPLDSSGMIDQAALTDTLLRYRERPLKIGSFSAASNVTGIRSDVQGISALLHAHGALACWDYAAAAPYVAIDMQGATPLDAVFISPHKFIGGPGTPGLLVVKEHLQRSPVPAISGGGTVSWVSPGGHRYLDDLERREEGGTPAVVESIRAGLVFKLRREVGDDTIETLEQGYVRRALAALDAHPKLTVLGGCDAERLAILSLRFHHGEHDLHHGFVVALLNDLFGIQARGGCSCAGPYGHALLGLDDKHSAALDRALQQGLGILRPGWVRLSFNYFIDEEEFSYLLEALQLVAEHGWRLLPFYHYNPRRGIWQWAGAEPAATSLDDWRFTDVARATGTPAALPLTGQLAEARGELLRVRDPGQAAALELPASAEHLRWFLLPQDALQALLAEAA